MHLILLARALPDQLRPAGDAAAEHPGRLVDDPHLGQKAAGEQLRQRPRVDLVRLRRLRRALDRLRVGEQDAIDLRREDPRDRQPVAGRLQRHPIRCSQALRERLERRRIGLHPANEPHLTRFRDRHLAAVAMHVERDTTHPSSSPRTKQTEPRRATRQLRIRAHGTSGQSQGQPTTNRGLAAHSVIRGPAQPACSLKPLIPERPRNVTGRPDTKEPHGRSFMPLQRAQATPSSATAAAERPRPNAAISFYRATPTRALIAAGEWVCLRRRVTRLGTASRQRFRVGLRR